MAIKENIYSKLAELPEDIADKITNAKTDGGRALDAIYALDGITPTQKSVLLLIGSRMTYSGEKFTGQYQFVSLTDISKKTSISRRSVIRAINGNIDNKNPSKNYPGLVELGYLMKKSGTKFEQINLKHANLYSLTPKIFSQYMNKLIEQAKVKLEEIKSLKFEAETKADKKENEDMHGNKEEKQKLVTPCHQASDTTTLGWCHRDTALVTPRHTISVESSAEPSVKPAVVQKATAHKKRKKQKGKSFESWEEFSNDKKMDLLLNYAMDSHRAGVQAGQFKPFNFELFPAILKPFFLKYNLDTIKSFYEFAIKENAYIHVNNSQNNFLKYLDKLEEVPATEEVPKVKAPTYFEDLNESVITFIQNSPANQQVAYKKEIQKIGKKNFEQLILAAIRRKERKVIRSVS